MNKANYFICLFLSVVGIDVVGMNIPCRIFTYKEEKEDTACIVQKMRDARLGNDGCELPSFAVYERRRREFENEFLAEIELRRAAISNFEKLIEEVPAIAACMNEKVNRKCWPKVPQKNVRKKYKKGKKKNQATVKKGVWAGRLRASKVILSQ